MKLNEALQKISPIRGVSSIIESVMTGDLGPISGGTADISVTLEAARNRLEQVIQLQRDCKSDAAYWGYMGDAAYWRCIISLLEAAELVGPDNLPDVPNMKQGVVVMDACSNMENWGRSVLEAAKQLNGEGR